MRKLCSLTGRKIIAVLCFSSCIIYSTFGQSSQDASGTSSTSGTQSTMNIITADIITANAKPTVFLQEGVTIPNQQSAPSFSPDGQTVYLSDNYSVRFSNLVNGKWSKPTLAEFSGHWKDWDAALSPDGKRIIFVSNRPLADSAQDKPQKNNQLWYTDHLPGDHWSTPRHLGIPVNKEGVNNYAPSISSKGTICFCSRRGETKKMKAYYTKWLGDRYDQPAILSLNGDKEIYDPYISPDETYILFVSDSKLFISYRHNDEWAAGQPLGAQVNNGGQNGGPYVSPDGKMLYYSSSSADGILMIPVNIPKTNNGLGQRTNPAALHHVIDTHSKPAVFAPGIVSTPYEEWSVSFTPDGKTVYFSEGTTYMAVCYSKMVNGKWGKPKVASFSGQWQDWDPFLSPDGKRLFFVSNRPLEGSNLAPVPQKNHLWYVDRDNGDNWSAAHQLKEPFNTDGVNNYAPTVSSLGTLYFCSYGRGGHKGWGSYVAKWMGDHFDQPQLLSLNGDAGTQDPFIAPDESYIIFVSGNDLYITFNEKGDWSTAEKLGPQINNGESISGPYVSPDGKMLYYATARSQGLYERTKNNRALDYDEFLKEMNNIYNGRPNILMIPFQPTSALPVIEPL
ncbi:hypothetical protein ACX0G9_15490 [Flavitalea flava]